MLLRVAGLPERVCKRKITVSNQQCSFKPSSTGALAVRNHAEIWNASACFCKHLKDKEANTDDARWGTTRLTQAKTAATSAHTTLSVLGTFTSKLCCRLPTLDGSVNDCCVRLLEWCMHP